MPFSGRPLAARLAAVTNDRSFVADPELQLPVGFLATHSLDCGGIALDGRAVLLATRRQIATARALVALDGVARRLVLCPPDLAPEHLPPLIEASGADCVIVDADSPERDFGLPCVRLDPTQGSPAPPRIPVATEWVLLTSGTNGRPKMVVHDLDSLSAPFAGATALEQGPVWSTFYDIRRYGGLTILLRTLLGGGSMVLSEPSEPVGGFLRRIAAAGVTHVSGTPSHWRSALMSPGASRFAPTNIRLSGEIADQALLDRLRAAFPASGVAHAFASTEAGVGFSVADGQEGFPASLVGQPGPVELRVEDGSLLIRSAGTARHTIGDGAPLRNADGFVDTGDMIELRGDRYVFAGRRTGVINVGGLKVHPEEVEAAINRHPLVRMSRVHGRRSPITGTLVVAELVLQQGTIGTAGLEADILAGCRKLLGRHKVPVAIAFVAALDILPTGKMARRIA